MPNHYYNLLSMRQLSKKGHNMQVYHGYCMLINRNRGFITKVKMTPNRLFPLKIHRKKHFLFEFYNFK